MYAVISDIHSNLDALEAVIDHIPNGMPILCLGDIVGYGAQPNEVIQAVQGLGPLVTIMGNHDHAVTSGNTEGFSTPAAMAIAWTRQHITSANLQFLSTLRSEVHLELDKIHVGLYHASPRDSLFEYIYPDLSQEETESLINLSKCRVVLLGHTHIPMKLSARTGIVANPGSIGQPRDGNPNASLGFLTLNAGKYDFENKRVKYDVESAATKIRQSGLPIFLARRLFNGT